MLPLLLDLEHLCFLRGFSLNAHTSIPFRAGPPPIPAASAWIVRATARLRGGEAYIAYLAFLPARFYITGLVYYIVALLVRWGWVVGVCGGWVAVEYRESVDCDRYVLHRAAGYVDCGG